MAGVLDDDGPFHVSRSSGEVVSVTYMPDEQVEALAGETFTTMLRVDWAREGWPRVSSEQVGVVQPEALGAKALVVALVAQQLCGDPLAAPPPADSDLAPADAAVRTSRLLGLWSQVGSGSARQNEVVTSLLPVLVDVEREVRRYVDRAR